MELLTSKPRHCLTVDATELDRYSSRWAVALIGAALFLVILVGMLRDITERWGRRKERRLRAGKCFATCRAKHERG